MIVDTIYIKDGEKLQVTCKLISNKDDIITLEPLTVVLEDLASFISDLPVDDRTTPEPPVITTDQPLIDDLTQIEMKLWCKTYISLVDNVRASSAKQYADEALSQFRESFGISIEPIETPE